MVGGRLGPGGIGGLPQQVGRGLASYRDPVSSGTPDRPSGRSVSVRCPMLVAVHLCHPPPQNRTCGIPASGSPASRSWVVTPVLSLSVEPMRPGALKPPSPFPVYAALPRPEYYEEVRLLPALPSPFGLAYRVRRTLSRHREVSHVPAPPLSAMPRSLTPPRSPHPVSGHVIDPGKRQRASRN